VPRERQTERERERILKYHPHCAEPVSGPPSQDPEIRT